MKHQIRNFPVSGVLPTLVRDLDRFPPEVDKVATAIASIQRNGGLWPVIPARLVEGRPQLPFGYARLEAVRYLHGEKHLVPFVIMDLTDEQMLLMYVWEGIEPRYTSARRLQECVRAVVQAYGDGIITLSSPKDRNPEQLRYAPGFLKGSNMVPTPRDHPHPYNAKSILQYLHHGFDKVKEYLAEVDPDGDHDVDEIGLYPTLVSETLRALELQELGALPAEAYDRLTTREAYAQTRFVGTSWTGLEAKARTHESRAEDLGQQVEELRVDIEEADPDDRESLEKQLTDLQRERDRELVQAERARTKAAADAEFIWPEIRDGLVDGDWSVGQVEKRSKKLLDEFHNSDWDTEDEDEDGDDDVGGDENEEPESGSGLSEVLEALEAAYEEIQDDLPNLNPEELAALRQDAARLLELSEWFDQDCRKWLSIARDRADFGILALVS